MLSVSIRSKIVTAINFLIYFSVISLLGCSETDQHYTHRVYIVSALSKQFEEYLDDSDFDYDKQNNHYVIFTEKEFDKFSLEVMRKFYAGIGKTRSWSEDRDNQTLICCDVSGSEYEFISYTYGDGILKDLEKDIAHTFRRYVDYASRGESTLSLPSVEFITPEKLSVVLLENSGSTNLAQIANEFFSKDSKNFMGRIYFAGHEHETRRTFVMTDYLHIPSIEHYLKSITITVEIKHKYL